MPLLTFPSRSAQVPGLNLRGVGRSGKGAGPVAAPDAAPPQQPPPSSPPPRPLAADGAAAQSTSPGAMLPGAAAPLGAVAADGTLRADAGPWAIAGLDTLDSGLGSCTFSQTTASSGGAPTAAGGGGGSIGGTLDVGERMSPRDFAALMRRETMDAASAGRQSP